MIMRKTHPIVGHLDLEKARRRTSSSRTRHRYWRTIRIDM